MTKYLDDNGLSYLWDKVTGKIDDERDGQLVSWAINSKFNGTKSVGFGDSNMAGTYFDNPETETAYGKVCAALGCTYDNRGVNSARFDSTFSNNIGTQIDSSEYDEDVRLVMVVGGINDFHYSEISYTTFLGNVRACINKIIQKFPNAAIIMTFDQGSQEPSSWMLRYAKAVKLASSEPAVRNRRIVAPFTSDLWMNADYYYNTNHYDGDGTTELANRCIDALFGVPITGECTRRVIQPVSGFTDCLAVVKTEIDQDTFIRRDDIDVFFGTSFAATTNPIPSGTTIFNLPFGFDSNQATAMHAVYDSMHAMRGNDSGVTFEDIVIKLEQSDSNFTSVTASPSTAFKFLYLTDASKLNNHRARYHYHNVMHPITHMQ